MLREKVLCRVISVTAMFVTAAVAPVAATLARMGSVNTMVRIPGREGCGEGRRVRRMCWRVW